MYNVSEAVQTLFKKNYRQVVQLVITTKSGQTYTLNESNILQGGLTIDRYNLSGNTLELGSAIAAQLTLRLKNDKGQLNNIKFEESEILVKIGIKKWDAHRWENAQITYIPCGVFVIDTPIRRSSVIKITAMDRMIKMDKTVDLRPPVPTMPIKIRDLISWICYKCGVTLYSESASMNWARNLGQNINYEVKSIPYDMTYRSILKECAFICGCCAVFNHNGELDFLNYINSENPVMTLNPSDRYSSDLYENRLEIKEIFYLTGNPELYDLGWGYGSIDPDQYNPLYYSLTFSECKLLDECTDYSTYEATAGRMADTLLGYSYQPFEAVIKSMPYLYPFDKITFVDSEGTHHDTVITHVSFTINRSTTIKCAGSTLAAEKIAHY